MALENLYKSTTGSLGRSRSMTDLYSLSKVSFSITEIEDKIHECQLSLSMPEMTDKIPLELSLSLSDMKDKIILELPMFEAEMKNKLPQESPVSFSDILDQIALELPVFEAERKEKIPPELPMVPTRRQPPRVAKRKLDLNVKSAKLKNLKAPKLHRTKGEDLDQILTNLLLGLW